jgi:arabinofuranan 3-O-arabinosyltransferase
LVVTVDYGGRRVDAVVDETGAVALPPQRTTRVVVTFGGTTPLQSFDLQRGTTTQLPVGVSEVLVRGALDLGRPVSRGAPTGVACGFGPVVEIDGAAAAQTRVTTTVGALLTGGPVAATTCSGPVTLSAGTHRVRVRSTSEVSVVSLALLPAGASGRTGASVESATVTSWGPTFRRVELEPSVEPRILELSENANHGWEAVASDGEALLPVVTDGWRQAFVIPSGTSGEVTLTFGPDRYYRAGLLVGAAALVLLAAMVLVPSRATAAVPPRPPASGTRRVPLSAIGTVGAGAALVGLWAVPAVVVGALVARSRLRRPLVAALGAVAALVAAVVPWPSSADTTWSTSLASVVAVAAVAGAAWPSRWPVGRRRPRDSVDEPPKA